MVHTDCNTKKVGGDTPTPTPSPTIHQYSTEERNVAKWLDGRDVYEKTFIVDHDVAISTGAYAELFPLPNGMTNYVDLFINCVGSNSWYYNPLAINTFATDNSVFSQCPQGTIIIIRYLKGE